MNVSPPDGENWLNELDYLTGGVGNKLIFDGELRGDTLSGRFDFAGSPAEIERHPEVQRAYLGA